MTKDELRALCVAATPGHWESYCPYGGTVYIETVIRPGVIQEIAAIGPTENTMQQPANAAYIAAMDPTTTLRLLDEIERLRGLLREALPRLVKGIVYDKIEQELSK